MTDLDALVGSWTTEAEHPMSPGLVVPGRSTFEWLEGGHFLIYRSRNEHELFPDSLSVIGDGEMHYFDSRGVRRVYQVSLSDGVWRMTRDHPGFSQRFAGTFSEDGDTITGQWELSRDDETWDLDLSVTFRRM
jgi:hypothetical protein